MRKFVSFILALMLVFGIASCHGRRGLEPFVMPEEFDASKNYKITFWAKNDTNLNQVAIYKKAIADFEDIYPNIDVELRLYTDYGRIYNDVITNIATNTTPNVCITYPDHIATYLTGANTVVSLGELFSDEEYGFGGSELLFDSPSKEEIVPQFLNECMIEDEYYAIPFMRSTEACYINKSYVEKLGFELPEKLTWSFVWEVAEAAAKKDEQGNFIVNGQKIMIPFIYKSTDNMMIQMTKQLGSGYSTDEGEILLFNNTTKDLLLDIAEHVRKGAFSTFKISSYPANFLNAGQCIFAVDSTAGATWMGSDAPLIDISEDKLVQFETAVMEVPQFDTENPKMISQGPSVCIFNKADPQEVLASWLFAQFLLSNDVQIAYSQTEGYAPVTLKAQNSEEYLAYINSDLNDELHYEVKLKATKLLLDNIGNTFVTPVFNGSASLRDAAGQMIENTTKSINRKETVDDAYMEKLFDDMTSLYRLDSISAGIARGKQNLGILPSTSVMLIAAIVLVWLGIIVYLAAEYLKNRRNKD